MAAPALPIVIVGAGPAGAGLALLLAQRGIAVTLIERQRDFEREFRGELVMPSGLAALDAMGVSVETSGLPQRRPQEIELYVERKLAFQATAEAALLGGRAPLLVSQPALLERLVAEAERLPGFRFLRGAAVRDLLRDDGRVAGVRVEAQAGEEALRARLVIGADGRASIVRRRGGFAVREIGAPMDVVWTKLPAPAELATRPVARAYVAGGHLLIAFPAPDAALQIAWVILKGGFGELKSRGIEEWVREMANHTSGELAAHLRAHAEQVQRPFLLSAATDRVRGWAQPGVLLLGDAAHTMSPVGGQGINVALRDAIVAANQLVPALRAGADAAVLDAAAAGIEAERGPEIDRIQSLAALPPRIVLARGALPSLVRRLLPLVLRIPLARSVAGRDLGQFLYGVTEVRLAV